MRIGIDLGGTKIEAIALDEKGGVLARQRITTPKDYDGTLAAIAGIVDHIEHDVGATGHVGIGIPGAVSPATGLVKNANSTWLIGHPLDKDVERVLNRPARLANDANCFAISEATDGAAAGKQVVFGVILGTGCGGGVVVNGQALTGPHAIGGEWGHNPLPWPRTDELPGRPCYCGKTGCIETWISGPGISADHKLHAGTALSAEDIVVAAKSGDRQARTTLQHFYDRLARSLAHVINILDPDAIVLGGGLSNIDAIYHEIPLLLPQYVFSDVVDTPVLKNRHGDSSGVRGAAWLWNDEPQ